MAATESHRNGQSVPPPPARPAPARPAAMPVRPAPAAPARPAAAPPARPVAAPAPPARPAAAFPQPAATPAAPARPTAAPAAPARPAAHPAPPTTAPAAPAAASAFPAPQPSTPPAQQTTPPPEPAPTGGGAFDRIRAQAPAAPPAPEPVDTSSLATFDALAANNEEPEHTGLFANLTGGITRRAKPNTEREEERLRSLIRQAKLSKSVHGKPVFYVAVWSQKGGVGKTTTAAGIAQSLAMQRPENILLADVNPDGGSAAVKVGQTTTKTILDLRHSVTTRDEALKLTPGSIAQYFNQHSSRLMSLVLPPGKKASPEEELTAKDFWTICLALEQLLPFKIMVIDCGTNPSSPVMSAVRLLVDQMVIITSTHPDEATVTSGGLASLRSSGFGYLVDRAITVIVDKEDPKSLRNVKLERQNEETRAEAKRRAKELHQAHLKQAQEIWDYFEENTARVVHVPNDPLIGLTSQLNVSDLSPAARLAYLEVATAIVESLDEQVKLSTPQ